MPYFITDTSPDCDGWATIKEDGEVIGCHETKQAAIDQMVAVSIAEGMEPGGERNLDGPPAIIVDIDGTLLTFEGEPIRNVVDFVDEYGGEVIIVTARVDDDRAETVAELEAADVDWDQLFMKPTADADSLAFKSETVKIGWVGGITHEEDLKLLERTFARMLSQCLGIDWATHPQCQLYSHLAFSPCYVLQPKQHLLLADRVHN